MKRSKKFKEHFMDIATKSERNFAIINAYLDGHSQVVIASHLKVSKSLISKVIKSRGSIAGVNGTKTKFRRVVVTKTIKRPYAKKHRSQ